MPPEIVRPIHAMSRYGSTLEGDALFVGYRKQIAVWWQQKKLPLDISQ